MGGAPPPPLVFAPPVRKSRPFRAGFRARGSMTGGGVGGRRTLPKRATPAGTVVPGTEGEGPEVRQGRGVIGSRSLEHSPDGQGASRRQCTALPWGDDMGPTSTSGRAEPRPDSLAIHSSNINTRCIDHPINVRRSSSSHRSSDDDHHHRVDHPTTFIIIAVDRYQRMTIIASIHRRRSTRTVGDPIGDTRPCQHRSHPPRLDPGPSGEIDPPGGGRYLTRCTPGGPGGAPRAPPGRPGVHFFWVFNNSPSRDRILVFSPPRFLGQNAPFLTPPGGTPQTTPQEPVQIVLSGPIAPPIGGISGPPWDPPPGGSPRGGPAGGGGPGGPRGGAPGDPLPDPPK